MKRPATSTYIALAGPYQGRRLWAAAVGAVGLAILAVVGSIPEFAYSATLCVATAAHACWRMQRPGGTALDSILWDSTGLLIILSLLRPASPVLVAAVLYMTVPSILLLEGRQSAWSVAYSIGGTALLPWAVGLPVRHGVIDTAVAVVAFFACLPLVAWMFGRLGEVVVSVQNLTSELDTTRSRFEDLFVRSKVAMFRSHPDRPLLDGNQALLELFGAATWTEFVSEPAAARYADPLERDRFLALLARRGRVQGFETPFRRMDGGRFFGRVSATLVFTPDGPVVEGMVEDITEQRAAERQVRLAARLFEQIGAAVVVTDADGKVVEWNSAAEDLLGHPGMEMRGQDATTALLSRAEATLDEIGQSLRVTGSWQGETEVVRADGRTVRCLGTITRHLDEQGRNLGAVTVLTDLTARVRAEQEARRQGDLANSVLNSVHVPIAVVGDDDTIVAVNPYWGRFAQAYGPPWDRIQAGIRISDLEPWIYSESVALEGLRAVMTGEKRIFTFESTCDLAGEERWFRTEFTAAPGLGVVVTHWDVTDERVARAALEEIIAAKDRFIASVSHELRTPLSVVIGLSQELAEGRIAISERPELERMLADQALEVSHLVEDLLVAARIDAGSLTVNPETIDLNAELERVVSPLMEIGATIALDIEENLVAFGDPLRLRQIFRNLLTNAIRHGEPPVEVVARRSRSGVEVVVADHGAGVPADAVGKIFDPYVRLARREGQPDSLGLGLHVSSRLAELMGCDLAYGDAHGYPEFTLSVPAHPGEAKGSGLGLAS